MLKLINVATESDYLITIIFKRFLNLDKVDFARNILGFANNGRSMKVIQYFFCSQIFTIFHDQF